jgi:hypothetical protein
MRKIPAIIVSGSPIIGTQLKNNVHFPYFKNHEDALVNCDLFIGNHFLSLRFVRKYPIHQFKIEPKILPMLAKKIRSIIGYFFKKINAVNIISE